MRSFNLRPFGLAASLILFSLVASGCFQTAGAALEATATPPGGIVFAPVAVVPSATVPLPTPIILPTSEATRTPTLIGFPTETPTPLFPSETPISTIDPNVFAPPVTFTPQFTYTPYPTYTPPPTYTAQPSLTPYPTAAPAIITPTKPGTRVAAARQDPQQTLNAQATGIIGTVTQAAAIQLTTIATLQGTFPVGQPQPGVPTQPPPPIGAGGTPTGAFIPIYYTATPAGTPGVPGSRAGGFFDGTTCRYFVVDGDTLYSIATRFNASVTALSRANGIVNIELIRPGQYLTIPTCGQFNGTVPTQIIVIQPGTARPPGSIPPLGGGSQTYVVREGDTLYGIASRFRVASSLIAQANGLNDLGLIYIGQKLIIP